MYSEASPNFGCPYPLRGQLVHCCGLPSRRWRPSFVFAFTLCLGNALSLTLQHHLSLELADRTQHREEQGARWRRCIEAEVQNAQRNTLLFQPFRDRQKVLRRPRQAIELAHDEGISL